MLPICCFLEALSTSFLTNMAGRRFTARRGGGPSERQAPATGSTRAEIGYPFPSREEEEAGSAAPSKLLTSCSGAGSKRNRPRQRKAGQGRERDGVASRMAGKDGGGEEFAFGGQLRIRFWWLPGPFLFCSALRCVHWTGYCAGMASLVSEE